MAEKTLSDTQVLELLRLIVGGNLGAAREYGESLIGEDGSNVSEV